MTAGMGTPITPAFSITLINSLLINAIITASRTNSEDAANAKKITKTERIWDIVLSSMSPISKAEIHAELSDDVGIGTIEKVLGDMVCDGAAEKRWGGRSTRYVKIDIINS